LAETEKGYPSLLFVNAQNKQTIRDIIGPLRAFGVPAAAIVDVDILKDGGGDWIPWIKAAHVPAALHVGLPEGSDDFVADLNENTPAFLAGCNIPFVFDQRHGLADPRGSIGLEARKFDEP
jgi:hypothetical protein